ncbi:NUDIX domain-containing protein [Microbacterium luticocti]|uniref:NUDIX domain-containing protein n=1 Tax=Microbacterium luticocti TaxID=451764 RepID=UPI000688CD9E|nr:NUDIX hydrolase [Microbacterium luticocti]
MPTEPGSDPGADRALRDLRSAVDAAPADDSELRVAGTAVLVRGGDAGPEVLMIERPDRGSFAGAWVFPGGGVEPADLRAGDAEQSDARRAAARETAEEVGLRIAPEHLHPFSCWTPPPGIPKRIRTWFFVGAVTDSVVTPAVAEVVEAAWVRPADVLDRHAAGRVVLYPPTWVTLYGLTGASDAAELVARARAAGVRTFHTRVRRCETGTVFCWEPDAAHDAGPDATGAATLDVPGPRHRLLTDALPWRYVVSD